MKHFLVFILFIQFTSMGQFTIVPVRGDYLYMSATEVSNEQYKLFLKEMEVCSVDSLQKYYPDTSSWLSEGSFNEPFARYYFQHPAYLNYPVVGINYEQVQGFCRWMATYLNKKDPSKKVEVRLPTETEWENAASNNTSRLYAWEGSLLLNDKGKAKANFVLGKGDYMGLSGGSKDEADITASVKSYKPNELGLYNMSGNVAEMVAEKGIVKGGSWKDRGDNLQIKKNGRLLKASSEVGFRFVVQVIKDYNVSNKTVKINKRFFKHYFKRANDSLLVGEVEVTNKLYRTYLKDIGVDCKPNDDGWNNQFSYSEYYGENYFYLKKYDDYPVVNITNKQAEDFCSWLAKKYEKVYGENRAIRLPTKKEWISIAEVKGSNYPWENNLLRDKKGNYQANFNTKNRSQLNPMIDEEAIVYSLSKFDDLQDFDGYALSNPVKTFSSSEKGVYGLGGNVAELVQENNLIMGGSWIHSSVLLQPRKYQAVTQDYAPYIGFRVVMVD